MLDKETILNNKKAYTTGFIILFLIIIIAMGPMFYASASQQIFVASPDWTSKMSKNAFIAGGVLGLISLPFLFVMTRNVTLGKRLSVLFTGFAFICGIVLMFTLSSLPVMLTMYHGTKETAYTVTVDSKTRRGKTRCDYPFNFKEVDGVFCASSADDYANLLIGKKIELFGKGNEYGLFVEGYRLID